MNIIHPLYSILVRFLPYWLVTQMTIIGQKLVSILKYKDVNFPRAFAIEISTHCNRSCTYCPQSVDPTKVQFIKDDVYDQILFRLQELKWAGPVDFHFYNEPLLDKNLEKRIKTLKIRLPKSMPRVLSNGDVLTEKRVLSLKEAGVFSIMVTQHPPYTVDWDKRMESLAKKYPQLVHVHNISKMELSTRGGLVKPERTEAQRLNREGCYAPSRCQHIGINGEYIWCCCDYKKQNLIGNAQDTRFIDAWNNPYWVHLRRGVNKKVPILDICKVCFEVGTLKVKAPPTENTPNQVFK